MPFIIRPFAPPDYEAMAAVSTAVFDLPTAVEEVRFEDESRPPHCRFHRWVAEVEGQVVGIGEYTHSPGRFHPRKFWVSVIAHPEHRGQGIGTAVYHTVTRALREFDPITLKAHTREDLTDGIRFIAKHGYREMMRTWESELDLATFDPAPWLPYQERAAGHGIQVKSLAELESDPERDQKLYDLVEVLRLDIPATEPATPLDFAHFVETTFHNPAYLPEGYLVAVAPDGQYVGSTALWKDSGDGVIWTGLTGVRREYRSMGIAQALKLRAILWAREQGTRGIRTFNASNNARMLAINVKMGFVRKPAWVEYNLVLQSES